MADYLNQQRNRGIVGSAARIHTTFYFLLLFDSFVTALEERHLNTEMRSKITKLFAVLISPYSVTKWYKYMHRVKPNYYYSFPPQTPIVIIPRNLSSPLPISPQPA